MALNFPPDYEPEMEFTFSESQLKRRDNDNTLLGFMVGVLVGAAGTWLWVRSETYIGLVN